MKTVSIRPPNSLILVMDLISGNVPEAMERRLVAATESCVAIGCRPEQDGPTQVQLVQRAECAGQDALVFDGTIATPTKRLAVCSVMNDEILSTEVASITTRVRIFANHATGPDRIVIEYDRIDN